MQQPAKPGTTRRNVLRLGAGLAAGATVTAASPAPAAAASGTTASARRHHTELVLLGTKGGPPPLGEQRHGTSSAVVVGEHTYVVDLGPGSYGQVHRAGIASLQGIFITHLHSDHIAELFTLPWLRHGGLNAFQGPIPVYGPGRAGGLPPARTGQNVPLVNPENPTPGTVDFIEKSIDAAAYDLNIRIRDENWADLRTVLQPHDIALPDVGASATGNLFPRMRPFEVFENSDVKVTATLVEHPPVFPAFGFRFDTAEGSVVFSGDTAVSPNLIELAAGADYLVHEVIALDWVAASNVPTSVLDHLAESHTDIDKVGAVAESAGVKNLVLNHLIPADPRELNDGQWHRRARRGFSGKVHVGNDLMRFGLGDKTGN
jgi:ribonuclease BN (tRNA processing enzyme)